ncbi:hypothetical protein C808_02643 [Lachnospiraceae bacterium M18-1]|nr:hypothetical protein C808_02643 [Lachnospiraceae bacterium M18-1]
MSRKKLFLSIVLMAALVSVGIVLPSMTRTEQNGTQKTEKNTDTLKTKTPTAAQAPSVNDTAVLPELQYLGFEYLDTFFSSTQTADLKEQLAAYLQETGHPGISSVTFLADKTTYPTSGETLLSFELSDGSTLPVTCLTATGTFLIGEERLQFYPEHSLSPRVYPRETDDSLPVVTTEEIESRQEGGYADTKNDIDGGTGNEDYGLTEGFSTNDSGGYTENSDQTISGVRIEINKEEAQP